METLLAALTLAASTLHVGTTPPLQPQTVYRSATGPIAAFAQDGSLLAWFAPESRSCNAVHVMSLSNNSQVTLPKETNGAHDVTCRWDVTADTTVRLALARNDVAALWTLPEQAPVGGSSTTTTRTPLRFDYVLGATVDLPTERRFTEVAHSPGGVGTWFGGIAGDGTTLVYAVTTVAYVDQVACLSGGSCALEVAGGGVHRIVGRSDQLLAGTPPALAVAAAGNRIALIPTAALDTDGQPLPGVDQPVQVRDARTGALVAKIATDASTGTPAAIALSSNVLAVLEQTATGSRLAWYDPSDGTLEGSVPVPTQTAPQLTASNQLIVFHVGRSLRAVDVATHRVRILATAAAMPVGLSLEGSRLAWAENVDDHGRRRGRIREISLAGRG